VLRGDDSRSFIIRAKAAGRALCLLSIMICSEDHDASSASGWIANYPIHAAVSTAHAAFADVTATAVPWTTTSSKNAIDFLK
jgi:hypothetical protein